MFVDFSTLIKADASLIPLAKTIGGGEKPKALPSCSTTVVKDALGEFVNTSICTSSAFCLHSQPPPDSLMGSESKREMALISDEADVT